MVEKSKEEKKIDSQTIEFFSDLLLKMKNKQSFTKDEIKRLLHLIGKGICRTYLFALFIKTLLYLANEYKLIQKATFFATNFKQKAIALLMKILRRKEFEEKIELQQ